MNSKTITAIAVFLLGCRSMGAQSPADAVGVSVDVHGAHLMHRSGVLNPGSGEGVVTADVRLDARGEVVDATIVSGPDQLRRAVLQSVLNWHFGPESANAVRPVTITFAPVRESPSVAQGSIAPAAPARAVNEILVMGLPDAERAELISRLPVHVGDILTPELRAATVTAIQSFDEHLTLGMRLQDIRPGIGLIIGIAGRFNSLETAPKAMLMATTPRNPENVTLISKVDPEYPGLAKAARVQGTVTFNAVIGKDGAVQKLELISGPPLLVHAAETAVKKWIYKPTLVNGQPAEVATTIDVNFALTEN